jgi:2-polyprenyl-3-methyl-5-hydroxy-6-metoxy-1,4-benzoquinol methylase
MTIFISKSMQGIVWKCESMEKIELGWDEFWAQIIRVRHRESIQGIDQYDKLVVSFIIEVLNLKKGNEILDIACGAGCHSIEFAKRGLKVTAFDIAQSLIEVAMKRASDAKVEVNFYAGDMRDMSFDSQFKAAVMLSHSFGFFDHEMNKYVLKETYDALQQGGCLLLDLMNPYNLPKFQKNWTQLEGGFLLNEPHVLDAHAGVLRGRPATFIDTEDDRIVMMDKDALSNNDTRMYTALEIREMLKEIGFSKIEFYGQHLLPRLQYSSDSERMVVIAHR